MSLITPLLQYLHSIHPLSDELSSELMSNIIVREYNKDDIILKAGRISNYSSWIINGLIRSYYIRDGEDITTKFLWEGAIVTAAYSFHSRKPSTENIVALEDTTLASLHYDVLQRLYLQYPELNFIGRVITEKYLYILEMEVFHLRKQKAEDRYSFVEKYFPHLVQRVPLKYLSTYLGMNLETLSRIRTKRTKPII